MLITAKTAEQESLLGTAKAMCAAARTAPKTKGQDFLDACILTEEDILKLADQMDVVGKETGALFLCRDAGNLRSSGAVVLLGAKNECRQLNGLCQYCGHADCAACAQAGSACIYTSLDLGIALGVAASVAAHHHVDSRILFSAGRVARDLHFLAPEFTEIFAIPLSVSGKSPYFDR